MRFINQRSSDSYPERVLIGAFIFLIVCGLTLGRSQSPSKSSTLAAALADDDAGPASWKNFSCLPKDVRADEAVSYTAKGKESLTVERKLVEMKARCRQGKLVDAKGREVRFFRSSCWGNPPPDYLEIRQRENEELAKLKKRYAVIVFGCNPMIQ
jgi:hypothetical protein